MKPIDLTPFFDFVKDKFNAVRDVRRNMLDGNPVTISLRGNIAASIGRRSEGGRPLTDTTDVDFDIALADIIAVAAAAAAVAAVARGVKKLIEKLSD